jgi:hypothetical protein
MRRFFSVLIFAGMLVGCSGYSPESIPVTAGARATPTVLYINPYPFRQAESRVAPTSIVPINPYPFFPDIPYPTQTLVPMPTKVVAEAITLNLRNVEVIGHARTIRADSISMKGDWAYVANIDDGLQAVAMAPVTLSKAGAKGLARIAGSLLGRGFARGELAVAGNFAYWVDEGSVKWASQIIDISDPTYSQKVGELSVFGYDIQVIDHLAYVVNQLGLDILDISNPYDVIEVGYYPWNAGTNPFNDYDISCTMSLGHLAVDGHFAYLTTCSGLRVINVENPENPVEMKFYPMEGPGAVEIKDDRLYVAWKNNPADGMPCSGSCNWDRGISILKTNPSGELSEIGTYRIRTEPHATIANLAVDSRLAYLAMNDYGVRLIDISHPSAPTEVGYFDTPGRASDIALGNGLVYVADGDSGVWIVKVTR